MNKISLLSLLVILNLFGCKNLSQNIENESIKTFSNNDSCDKVKNYLTGDPKDIVTKTEPITVLMGGGKDVDQAFKEMIKKSGAGDFVILRTSGADGYNSYIYNELGGVNSVETLMIDSTEKANCPEIEEKIKNAEALFISGGDQSTYYNYWKNSKVQESLNYLINTKKIPIGGTSAGLAILGDIVYTAENASVNSEESLINPLSDRITLKKDFLSIPILKNVITDTHFNQRDRQGRIISFMANAIKNNLSNYNSIRGIGVDENTAYVLQNNGIGKVYGTNNAWFFKTNSKPNNYKPLDWSIINTIKVKGTETGINSFDLIKWKVDQVNEINLSYSVEKGKLISSSIKK